VRNRECLFAPRPLANFLWSDPAVPIWPYTSGSVLDFDGPSVPTAFTAIDLDVWGRALAEAIDRVTAAGHGDAVRSVQETLAQRFSELMLPVFADQAPDPEGLAAAREAYRKTLLIALANAYADSGAAAPLRSAPAPLVLVSQSATIDGLLQWRYSVEYAQFDRAAEDQIGFILASEIPPGAAGPTESNSFFQALAEFAAVYPALREDLEGQDPALAEAARGSFVNVVARVVAEWSEAPPVPHAPADGMATITEFGRDGKLVIRVDGASEVVTPLIAGYTTPAPPTGPPFEYEFVAPDGEYLGEIEGRALPRRQLLSPPRQILLSRTGAFAATVIRNAQFAPDFIYHSGPVTFAAPVYPTIDSEEPVALTEFATPPSTLAEYFKGLFDWVFGAGLAAVETSLSGKYELDGVAWPIFEAPGLTGAPDPAAIEGVVAQWMRETEPVREGGMLRFDFSVRSFLRLRNISVSIGDVAGL
jgi:hypothetical protein